MEEFLAYLKENKLTLSTCESCTGGLLASSICEYPGVSSIYKGSVVTYATSIKENVVGVSHELISKYGVVSEQVAVDMAKKCQKLMDSHVCISYTGNAGPDCCDDKPVGRVYCGFVICDRSYVIELQLNGTRNEVRKQAIVESVKKIKEILGI